MKKHEWLSEFPEGYVWYYDNGDEINVIFNITPYKKNGLLHRFVMFIILSI